MTWTIIRYLDEAMTAIGTGQYEEALSILPKIGPSYSYRKRQVETMALEGLGRTEELIRLFDPPQAVDEVVKGISLLLDANRLDEAKARLEKASALVDPATYEQLAAFIATRRIIL